MLMNELIMPHNIGVKKALENMEEVLALYKKVIGNYRPLLDGERYLTDREVAEVLKVSRRTLQEYRNDGVLPYILLGGKVLYRESDLEKVLESCYHPARYPWETASCPIAAECQALNSATRKCPLPVETPSLGKRAHPIPTPGTGVIEKCCLQKAFENPAWR